MKQIFKVALVIMGGVICTHSAVAQTKAIEVNAEGNMRFYGGNATGTNSYDMRFGDNQDWSIEYYNNGLNFWKPTLANGDGKLFLHDNGNVGVGTLFPSSKLHVAGSTRIDGNVDITGGFTTISGIMNLSGSMNFRGTAKFDGIVSVNNITIYSDKRIKENIHGIETPLAKLTKLKGVQYDLRKSFMSDSSARVVHKKRDIRKDNIGFLAQDLQKIYPELVVEDSTGLLGINYIGLIPVLVEALKEQQVQVSLQQAQITILQQQVSALSANTTPGKGKLKSSSADAEAASAAPSTSAGIVLYQNSPNPFSTSTEIAMELPKEVQDAQLTVYNLAGEQRLSISVTDRGATTVRIEAGQLKPGIYIYGIIADGQLATSKQMVVTE